MSGKRSYISRRTVLRGAGISMGLPFLEAMRPAGALAVSQAGKPPVRMACLFFPNGVHPGKWTPKGAGKNFELSPILEPLGDLKDDVLVLTQLMHENSDTGDGHYVKTSGWLTGTTITRTRGEDLRAGGVSMDQLAAQQIGHETPLRSLELGIEPVTTGVDTNVGYTRLYGSHISWSTPTRPVAKEINPKLAFDRLFRSETGGRKGSAAGDRSVLDLVKDDAKSLRQRVGQNDRRKLDQYLESVRSIERRIEFEAKDRKAQYMDDTAARREIERLGKRVDAYHQDPGGARERTADLTEHVRLMFDIMTLAFQTDSTRISTFMFGNAVSGKNFSFLDGVGGGHHQLSHHQGDKEKLRQYELINRWHVAQYAYLLDRMRNVEEGDGTLLDNSMVMFGSGLRDGNAHSPHNLPIVLGGGGGGTLAPGRHVVYGKDTPLSNLYLSMLDRVGAPVDQFADSTGPLAGLDDPKATGPAAG